MKKSISVFKYKGLLATISFLICVQLAHAQYVNDLKKSADYYYNKGDYYSAAVYFQKYVDKNVTASGIAEQPYVVQNKPKSSSSNQKATATAQEAVYKLAESYRLINDYQNAEKWYAEAVKTPSANHPDLVYNYATTLRATGKYEEAKQQFQKYLANSSNGQTYKDQAVLEIKNLDFIIQQLKSKDAALVSVTKMNDNFNSEGADYAAVSNNNTVFFTSTRSTTGDKEKANFNALYQAKQAGTGQAEITKLDIPVAKGTEQGVASFNTAGDKVYLTRWIKKNGINMAAIYLSSNKEGAWTEPVKLAMVNADGYSSQQPFISADGQYLIFSSNQPGGSGKFDLWYAALDQNGLPTNTQNMGSIINSVNDEQAPFYHQNTGNLVFASNGRVGMGGLDLFSSKGSIGGSWAEPKNLGYPVNSNKDDLYFSSKSNSQLLANASISSDRGSDCCLSLFTVSKTYNKYVTGKIIDSKTNSPISGVNVNITEINKTLTTDQNGVYLLELDQFKPLSLTASKDTYQESTLSFYKPQGADADSLYNADLVLVLKPVTQPSEEQKVYFDFDKYELQAETTTILDKLAKILKAQNNIALEINGYTDSKGSDEYNQKLSEARAKACKAYLVKSGIAESKIRAAGKGKSAVTGDDAKDRKVEFRLLLLVD